MAVKFCKRNTTPYIATTDYDFTASELGNKFIIYDYTKMVKGVTYYCVDTGEDKTWYNPSGEVVEETYEDFYFNMTIESMTTTGYSNDNEENESIIVGATSYNVNVKLYAGENENDENSVLVHNLSLTYVARSQSVGSLLSEFVANGSTQISSYFNSLTQQVLSLLKLDTWGKFFTLVNSIYNNTTSPSKAYDLYRDYDTTISDFASAGVTNSYWYFNKK